MTRSVKEDVQKVLAQAESLVRFAASLQKRLDVDENEGLFMALQGIVDNFELEFVRKLRREVKKFQEDNK